MQSFLGRLSESEKTLKYGVFPEEEAAVQECQNQLQVSARRRPPPPGTSPILLQDVPLLVPLAAPAGTCHDVGCCQTWALGPQAPRGMEIWGPMHPAQGQTCSQHPAPFPSLDARLGGSRSRRLWTRDAGGWDPTVPHSVCPPRS